MWLNYNKSARIGANWPIQKWLVWQIKRFKSSERWSADKLIRNGSLIEQRSVSFAEIAEQVHGKNPLPDGRLPSTPRADGFYMPAEWAKHKQTWLFWPERPDVWRLGGKPAQAAFTNVAKAIARFEPVTVGVSARQYENARSRLNHSDIRLVEITSDDAWVRDTGPTFVINDKGEVRGIDWRFNAWGGLNGGIYFPWARDDQVAQKIIEIERYPRYRTDGFALEGGSIHVDGEGTLITIADCLLHPNRNPHLRPYEIEAVLREYLSVDKIIWLPHGIFNDGANGHIDNLCCFVRPGEVLLSWTDDVNDRNFPACHAALDVLEQATDAKGRKLHIRKLQLPVMYSTEEERAGVDYSTSVLFKPDSRISGSYVNMAVVNGGIIAPSFGDDARDAEALKIMQEAWPELEIVQIYSRDIILAFGNIHCMTQQQPAGQERKAIQSKS
jgi:agmatine deiminase